MVRRSRALAVAVVLIALIGLSGVVLGRIYADGLLVRAVGGAGFGSVAIGLAARRRPSWLVAPLSVLGLAGYVALVLTLTAARAEPAGGLLDATLDAGRNGIPRLLTALMPVRSAPETVLVPVVAAWLAGLAGAELALRAGRVLLGYGPPALLYAGALYLVGPNAAPARWPTVAFAAAAALGLAVAGRPPPLRPATAGTTGATGAGAGTAGGTAGWRARVPAGPAATLAAVVGLTALAAPVVARRVDPPIDPRQYVRPPRVDVLDENPLTRISGWALAPEQRLFDVRTEGDPARAGPAGVRIRLAVLTDYDGVTWRVGATYRNAGRILPPAGANADGANPDGANPDGANPGNAGSGDEAAGGTDSGDGSPDIAGAGGSTVRQVITIGDLSGRLLPAVATPREVTGARVAYDPASGTLIRPEGLVPGLRYEVTSVRDRPDLNLLSTADVPATDPTDGDATGGKGTAGGETAGDAVARALRVADGVPEPLRRLADRLAQDGGDTPYARASVIEQFLAEHYRLVSDAPSGHAYPNLGFFLLGPRAGGGQRGSSEQFAAAYAVLGRLMGLPTRVVVGFEPATGTGPVRGADAYAWPEVLFAGVGWVAFDPLPRPGTQPRPVEDDLRPEPADSPPPPEQTPPSVAAATAAADRPAAPHRPAGAPTATLAGTGIGALLLVVAGPVIGVAMLRRGQRRRRLGAGSPAHRVAGAWREVTDALRLAGRPVPEHLAATEVAAHAQRAAADAPAARRGPPVPPIDDLASLVNLAAFAPARASEDQARRAAAAAVAYARALRARRPWWRRALWSLHPGPLRWPR